MLCEGYAPIEILARSGAICMEYVVADTILRE